MIKSRDRAKVELNYAVNNLDWVLKHLKKFGELGYADIEEFRVQIVALGNAIMELQTAISRLKDSF
ncbi:unnamed protein product [marine sediment metagenome]|uniref:Uncharacterized protein n=1 Tax=marine sediment metagenome TaxID=412755 RepID=X1UDU2_9ZZZZ